MNYRRISPITYLLVISSLLLVLAFVAPQLWSQPSATSNGGDSVNTYPPSGEQDPGDNAAVEDTRPDVDVQGPPSPGENQILEKLEEIATQNQEIRFEIRQQAEDIGRSNLLPVMLMILNILINFLVILFLIIPRFFSSNSPRRERPPLAQDSPSSPSIYGFPSTRRESRSGTTNSVTTSTPQAQTPPSSPSRPGLGPATYNPQPSPTPSQHSSSQWTTTSSPSPSISSNEAQNIVAVYNKRARELKQNSTSVSIPKETLNQIRSGQSVPMSFTPDNNGNYWLVQSRTSNLSYLVPKENLVVSEPTFKSLSQIFESQNYGTTYARNYRLIEPAQVQKNSANQWQLVRRGQIVFG